MVSSLFLSGTRHQPQVLSKAKESGAYLVLHRGVRQWARLTAGDIHIYSLFWKNGVTFCCNCRLRHRGRASGRSCRKSITLVHSRVDGFCGIIIGVAECVVTRGDCVRRNIMHMVLRLVVKAHRSRTVGYVMSCLLCGHDQR